MVVVTSKLGHRLEGEGRTDLAVEVASFEDTDELGAAVLLEAFVGSGQQTAGLVERVGLAVPVFDMRVIDRRTAEKSQAGTMKFVPRMERRVDHHGQLVITLGDLLLDDYLALGAALARTDTLLAVASDLKVFFSADDRIRRLPRQRESSRAISRSRARSFHSSSGCRPVRAALGRAVLADHGAGPTLGYPKRSTRTSTAIRRRPGAPFSLGRVVMPMSG